MARKLLSSEEAAQVLGVTPEEVHQFRERQELYGLRDGGTWKFKEEDVQRLAEERASGGGGSGLSGLSLELGEPDSVLLSEKELGNSPDTTSSTIIGSKGKKSSGGESDILLSGATPPPMKKKSGASDLNLASSSDLNLSPSDSGKQFEDLDDFSAVEPTPSGVNLGSENPKGPASSSEINLVEELKPGSTGKGLLADSSNLNLSDDDELVLGGSGSDVTLGTGDSGIGLSSPSDSGLNLEEPLELGGSKVEMMELGEDDVVSLEEDADLDAATQLKADDEFLLTPSSGGDDASDSGSQVIALEGDEEFAPAGMAAAGGMLVADDMGAAAMSGMAGGPQMVYAPSVPEAPYSVFNVAALFLCVIFLFICGMFMFDLIRNMWSWTEPIDVNSSMMNAVLKWFGN